MWINCCNQEKERRRLVALEEHNARLGGVDAISQKLASATIDQKAEEEAILADDMAPRSSYSGRYASFDPDELDAVNALCRPVCHRLDSRNRRFWLSLTRTGCRQNHRVLETFSHGLHLRTSRLFSGLRRR
jgi:hypothetical protein